MKALSFLTVGNRFKTHQALSQSSTTRVISGAPSKPFPRLTPPYFRLSSSSTELVDIPGRQARFLWFHTPLASLQGSTGAPSHVHPYPPPAAPTSLLSCGDGEKGWRGEGGSPVGLALSRWLGCSCWMPAGSWPGMWMAAACEAGVWSPDSLEASASELKTWQKSSS